MENKYYSKLYDALYKELYDKLYDQLYYELFCDIRDYSDCKEEQIKNKQDCKSIDADLEQEMPCFPCKDFEKVFEWCTRNWRRAAILPKLNETVHVYVNNGEYATVCCGYVNDSGKWTLDCDSTFCPKDIKKWEYASEWQLESTENPTVAIFKIKNDPMYGRKNHISCR